MQHAIFLWDKGPTNYLTVCLQSLRLYNRRCNIHLHYLQESLIDAYKDLDIKFRKINPSELKGKRLFYKINQSRLLCEKSKEGDQILVFDNDLLFQNDPFRMFLDNKNGDLYYTHCIMSKPESLRPEGLWKSVRYRVNGGVRGFIANENSRKFLNFWIDNLLNPTWDKWIEHPPHRSHQADKARTVIDWWGDQDFLNCVDINDPPFELKRIDATYKYNYFTSTWGFFNDELNMGNKIGNPDYCVIHFKGNFKDVFNISNPNIYNLDNILAKKDLTTPESRARIKAKFLSRGEQRFHVV